MVMAANVGRIAPSASCVRATWAMAFASAPRIPPALPGEIGP
jgi:hypothetical protein